jgi:hypothetical protein
MGLDESENPFGSQTLGLTVSSGSLRQPNWIGMIPALWRDCLADISIRWQLPSNTYCDRRRLFYMRQVMRFFQIVCKKLLHYRTADEPIAFLGLCQGKFEQPNI